LKKVNIFVISLVNFVGIGINDDISYIQNARALAEGNNPISPAFDQRAFRLGMVAPLALLYKLFGYNELGFSLYPLICSLITCALIYLTAARLWGIGAAIFACLLWIAYPLQIVFDTQLSPSNQQAACVAAALFFYFYSITDRTSSGISRFNFSSKWREPVLLTLCGMFLGLGWWINEIFVTFILVVIPFLFIVRPKIKHLFWIITGFLFIIFLELLVVKILSGSWLARFSCILETEAAVQSNREYGYLPKVLFKIWNINPFHDEGHFGIIWYLFIIVTVLALLLKQKLPLALALGCWLWLVYLQWGVQSYDFTPIVKFIRYISMIVPVQCLVFGAILGHIFKFSKRLKPVLVFLFILLLIHLSWLGTKAVNTVKIHTEDFREIAKFLTNLGLKSDDIIYTDFLSGDFVEVYSKGSLNIQKASIEDVNNFRMLNPPEKGFLVKDGSRAVFELSEYRSAMPEWYLSPPAHWPLLYTVHGKKVEVYEEFDPKIYRILPQDLK
jgi:4-amino-4-deoxy-L-arabinose transferase-like glycosyltransferase